MRPMPSDMNKRWRRLAIAPLALMIGGLGWGAFAPVARGSHEEVFEIPPGTSARRLAGEDLDILPHRIRLTLGLNDVLVLKNADKAPHIFGPTLIMPGQTFRLPFTTPSINTFTCTAHSDGQLNVIVEAAPSPGWRRLRWRWRGLTDAT